MRRKHHNLVAWQQAITLVEDVYRLTASFPNFETYGLSAQMRRAAVSIPSNIAEGAARNGSREFVHFLGMARGSLSELHTQPTIAQKLGYATDISQHEKQIDELFALLGGLINSLREKNP